MSTNDDYEPEEWGIIVPDPNDEHDPIEKEAYAVLDSTVYNIIAELLMNTHREEKIARGVTAAILVEQKADQSNPNDPDELSGVAALPHKVETEAAVYENGAIYLKGNPLENISEIRCPKCKLPRLLHPTDGVGAKKPEPGVVYCNKRPFIVKPHHDIYGQTFVPDGPGRGKKKKDMIDPTKADTPNGSQGGSPPAEGPAKPIAFPHSKCQNCDKFMPIKRMNNHMAKCIGGNTRESARNAYSKIKEGNGNGSQNGNSSDKSRNSTPAPSANSKNNRSSPNKRDPIDDLDDDESPQKKKKPLKKNPATKLKASGTKMSKSASQQSSNLSFAEKPPLSDEEVDEDGDDDRDGDFGSSTEKKKKLSKPKMPVKKATAIPIKKKSKWLYGGKDNSASKTLPPPILPEKKTKPEVNGNGAASSGARGGSESSQTLSSPN